MSLTAVRLSSLLLRNLPKLRIVNSCQTSSAPQSVFATRQFASSSGLRLSQKEWVEVTYETTDGASFTVKGKEGDNLLDVVINNNVDLDGFGACEGTLSCSTCHLIFKKEDFDKIEDPCTDEELDMLDLAYGLTDTSRLGCQVCLNKALNGLKVQVPEGTADAREV